MPVRQALTVVALAAAIAQRVGAQAPLEGRSGGQLGPTFEHWSFGCCTSDSATQSVRSAWEMTIPVIGAVGMGRHITFDAYAAYMVGEVRFRDSAAVPERRARIDGVTDVKLRASVKLHGDDILATFGVSLPTGKTSLDSSELAALRVLGAPVLRAQTPTLGTGWSGTSGVVVTRKIGGWAWGAGASFEHRGTYTPVQAAALGLGSSISRVDLDPGEAIRVSVGTDGLVGSSALALSVSSTFYTKDRLTLTAPSGPPTPVDVTLGPVFTGEMRLRTCVAGFRELGIWALDRYRLRYKDQNGTPVAGTSGNELDFGAQGMVPLTPRVGFVAGLRGRHFTGLSVDNSLATAATFTGGGQVGLSWSFPRMVVQPMVGGELGRIDSGGHTLNVRKVDVTITVSSR